jgi:hypothetical protein
MHKLNISLAVIALDVDADDDAFLLLGANNRRNNKNRNAKTNHKVCIADQEISFTACILLHSLPLSF